MNVRCGLEKGLEVLLALWHEHINKKSDPQFHTVA